MEELPEKNENGRCAKQKKKNQKYKLLFELLLDFAKNTTLHGLRYVTERGLSVVEKIFWIITFLISLSVCLWLIGNVWVKWQTSPVLVTLSEKLMSVTEVPFPAVTICPETKTKQNAYNFTDNIIKYLTLSNNATNRGHSIGEAKQNIIQHYPSMKTLFNLAMVCDDFDYYFDYGNTTFKTDHAAVEDILKSAPQLHDFSWSLGMKWRDEWPTGLSTNFDSVLTTEGLCFTFNSLAASEIFTMESIQRNYSYSKASRPKKKWTLEEGYTSSEKDTYPRRAKANGPEEDLVLQLNEVLDRDIMCDGERRGFKVYLHHPADLPQSSLYHYSVHPGQVASFAIKVSVMKTSDTLVKYSPQIRQCYFPWEKKLRYFQIYTFNNCQLECGTNYTLALCGCVWFHMPHNDSTVLCENTMIRCVLRAVEHTIDDTKNSCLCLPSCDNVQYEADVEKTVSNARSLDKVQKAVYAKVHENLYKTNHDPPRSDEKSTEESNESSLSTILMYFKEPRFVSMRRSELFGLTDFLANCGGLLGLFLGFSFLSIVEIIYFFTLRLGCMFRRNNVAKKKKTRN